MRVNIHSTAISNKAIHLGAKPLINKAESLWVIRPTSIIEIFPMLIIPESDIVISV